jgi:hypothetical protein
MLQDTLLSGSNYLKYDCKLENPSYNFPKYYVKYDEDIFYAVTILEEVTQKLC